MGGRSPISRKPDVIVRSPPLPNIWGRPFFWRQPNINRPPLYIRFVLRQKPRRINVLRRSLNAAKKVMFGCVTTETLAVYRARQKTPCHRCHGQNVKKKEAMPQPESSAVAGLRCIQPLKRTVAWLGFAPSGKGCAMTAIARSIAAENLAAPQP